MTTEEFKSGLASAIADCESEIMDNRRFDLLNSFIDRVETEGKNSVILASCSSAQGIIMRAKKFRSAKNRLKCLSDIKFSLASIPAILAKQGQANKKE